MSLTARVSGWRAELAGLRVQLVRRWRDREPDLAWRAATWLVLVYAAVQAVRAYSVGFDAPLLDRHAFRQTQTAISTYYIAHGGPLFAYETPVFGAPYSAPFEFPLYQWIVALVNVGAHVPLDRAGRAVSIIFFVLTIVPFFRLLRSWGVSPASTRLAIAVLVTAPEYLYWTRAFLIESMALCLALTFLAVGVEILEKPAIDRRLAWLLVSSTLALLVKVTTAFGYLAVLGCILTARLLRDPDRRAHARAYVAIALSAFVLPALPLLAWTRFADYQKGLNPLTAHFITSSALHDWNYGTWEQKLSLATWQTLWDRTMDVSFGSSLGFCACATLAVFCARRMETAIAPIVGAVATYGIFTNLHLIHDYYQYSTSALAVAVVGVGLGAAEVGFPRSKALLLVLAGAIVLESTSTYREKDLPAQTEIDLDPVRMGAFIQAHTPQSAIVAVYGDDWSSVIPYYAQRRALTDRWNHDPNDPVIRESLQRSSDQGNALAAVVSCFGERPRSRDRATRLLDRPPACTAFAHCDVCL